MHLLWSLDDVSVSGRRVPRLDRVTVQIPQGVTAVLGQSGAGKTTLLNLLVHYERPTSGQIIFGETSHSVFWSPPTQGLWSHLTVRDHLESVRQDLGVHQSTGEANYVDRLLSVFDLMELSAVRPGSLSLGERSRLSVARALASGAKVLVMDEPLAHVDPGRVGSYWAIVRDHCSKTGTSLIFATHAPEVVLREASLVLCLANGRQSYFGPVNELYDQPSSPELAAMLGPCNWLPVGEATRWLNVSVCSPQEVTDHEQVAICIRPERLRIERAAEGSSLVEGARFAGSSGEVDLVDERDGHRRTFVHRPSGLDLRKGERVMLKWIPPIA